MASSGEKYDACPAANALTNEAKISAFYIQKWWRALKHRLSNISPELSTHCRASDLANAQNWDRDAGNCACFHEDTLRHMFRLTVAKWRCHGVGLEGLLGDGCGSWLLVCHHLLFIIYEGHPSISIQQPDLCYSTHGASYYQSALPLGGIARFYAKTISLYDYVIIAGLVCLSTH
jgi:hypothetical protein